ETHTHLRPQVLPYTSALKKLTAPDAQWVILITQILALLLLVLACGNVGILILARVATRSSEIAIRTALGASRIRILSQLFIESLVLAVLAAGAGLLLLQAVATSPGFLLGELPYWVDFEVSLKTTLLALSLAVLSAAIAGVVPALKATGKRVQATIQSGSGSGIRFGKGYSALIVGEVAVALLFLAIGSWLMPALLAKPAELGIPTDQYLYATLRISRVDPMAKVEASNNPEFVRRVAVAQEELARRLSEEPGLGPVAVADVFPGMSHRSGWIQIEGLPRGPGAPAPGYLVNVARVDLRYFEAMKMPILSGRNFNNADLGEDRSAVMVNTSFVERVLGGRNPIGRRIRYWEAGKEPGPWAFEIVGVVEGLGMNALNPAADQGVYHVVAPGELHPLTIALRVGSDPARFTARLRSVVNEIDASALIQRVEPLNEVPHPERSILVMGTYLVALLAGIAVVLATACLYALMSFTVAKRTRECAIRTALGARPIGIMATIARKVFFQLSAGVMIGALLSAGFLSNLNSHGGMLPGTPSWPLNVALITLLVIAIAVLACVKPTLRAIRIRPVDALKG
ncbi:MAG: FtsX-like permease family protein, partial [Longimicrobiales bacterium]